ncbi:hypothetical protein J5N97_016474 [Dioscorea zingiberensis]|uniref:Palmitoyltransferase DHHC domain-containing protein n=1 Tax=Dioscorea zingiberensis TaxID=325984 RepID=A0A9D5HFF2_9LILI|nr:hypothetical protein J5N97_016474 [Dioscorea zingiberensis]
MAGNAGDRSLKETPTWAVALVCAVMVIISVAMEHGLHSLGKWFQKRQKKAMNEALEKIKAELMLLGFISLLLTIGQAPISKICIPARIGDIMLPCHKISGASTVDDDQSRRKLLQHDDEPYRRFLAGTTSDQCSKHEGWVPLISQSGIHQLHIFIFVLAVFHVLYSVITMVLGKAKMKKWKAWETETTSLEYQFSNDPSRFRLTHQTSFVKRHLGLSSTPGIRWIVAFFRQFYGSVTKVDYLTMRHGFINAHLSQNSKFNFHKYIKRSLEDDFKVVVGISPPLWFLAIIILLLDVYGFYTLVWIAFVPLIVLLLVGMKLEIVIMEMAHHIQERTSVIKGAPIVEPSNHYFWFNRPQWILFLIHLTLFENAFQLAHFLWTWYTFGLRTCLHDNLTLTLFLCSYMIFPLYALVTQVVAITVFFILSIAFYAFFAPFLGKSLYEYVAVGVYSFLVRDGTSIEEPKKVALESEEKHRRCNTKICSTICGFFCGFIVKEDCRKNESMQQANNDEALFCTLCNAEVQKDSKHCRSCDKCVDGFDHHCRWLNNCVGRKNYITFLFLMAMSLAWLAVEFGVGVAVLVRCFVDKRDTEALIMKKLGSGFSQAPFATIVALCTTLSLLASVPLGELFFFHILLIRKGITTYEYVVAMRTQSEPPGPSINLEQQSLPSSPNSSAATGISESSLGLQYRGAWCTPPRVFVGQLDEIVPHLDPGSLPSTVDPDAVENKAIKRPVRISAWKLAKLDSNEAIKAAAKARASSSVLRPINHRNQYETDQCSSGTCTLNSYAPSQASREDAETHPQSQSNLGSPVQGSKQHSNTKHFNPIYQQSANHSPLSVKSNDGMDSEHIAVKKSNMNAPVNSRTSVYWDQNAGRFVSSQSTTGSSSQCARTELTYTGHSIFFGGPVLAGNAAKGSGSAGAPNHRLGLGRGRGSDQLPLFVPSDSQKE